MVTRENIHIPSVESKTVQSKVGAVGVVALNQFGDEALSEVQAAIAALPKNMKAFVLDLRFNGGGYLDGAVDLVSLFQRTGTVVTVVRRDGPSEVHSVSGKVLLPDIPMVVLINGGSASASEITAGALKDLNRATIIGTQSFGKGTVQEIIDLPGGSALRVTTAKWQTPSGHDLGKTGITPDVVVDRTAEEYKAGKDPQLDAAVKFFEEKK
jgi:carboxyl-terminal processing protease